MYKREKEGKEKKVIGKKWAIPGTEPMPGLKEKGKKVALHRIEPGSTDTNG